jgi:ABC-type multidrug transport system fused ATPase/permease subunit
MRRRPVLVEVGWAAAVALASATVPASLSAEDAGSVVLGMPGDGGVPLAPVVEDPRTTQLRALMAGALDTGVSPQSLFEVSLADEAAMEIEATRIRALLHAAAEAARPPLAAAGPRVRGAGSEPPDAGTLRSELERVDQRLWETRLELDRARLEFYSLSPVARGELLRAHESRQQAARPRESEQARRAREAEAERGRALAAAKAARTEAERLVSEELARLLALEASVNRARAGFEAEWAKILEDKDIVLGWHRRVRDAKEAGSADPDSTYDALRRALRGARDDLTGALDALSDAATMIPDPGPDPLSEVPSDVQTEHAREQRAAVVRAIAQARQEERALRERRAAALLEEITALNRDRLGLLPYLSASKRDAITGFTAAGWDQARSEARQLALILRYHRHVALDWLISFRSGGSAGVSPWKAAALAVPLLLAIVVFLWTRRRTHPLLIHLEARIRAADRAERRMTPSVARRTVRVLAKVHRPLEWLVLYAVVIWLLPRSALELLEVQLVSSAVGWILAGSLIVNTIDALAAGSANSQQSAQNGAETIRLRSLRLVGRTVVAFALILVLSSRLVGQGTIYSWVFSTCWFAALPVFLLIVRWWRGTVFERMDRVRKKTALEAWVLANRSGWKSFLAAMVGALHLFGTGIVKTVRGWLSGFDVARRVHAYLFKREIERLGGERPNASLRPPNDGALEWLHPEHELADWIASPSDPIVDRLRQRVGQQRGGIIAIVGARGMGKSSLLRLLAREHPHAVSMSCAAHMELAHVRDVYDGQAKAAQTAPRLLLLDDAHALIKPCIGGLATFDDVIAFARGNATHSLWVLAVDAALWPLLKRARDARPIFDETSILAPWNETQIGALLADRCARAGIAPIYDDLLDKLPPGSDEVDRQDALRAKQAGYERMLWDHVSGNPALALEAWRASLAQDERGILHVRSLQVPDTSRLDALPDSSLFILRAVLQLAPAGADAVAQATGLLPDEVIQEFRLEQAHGVFVEHDGGMRVSWHWLRAVTRLLERRHLLVMP